MEDENVKQVLGERGVVLREGMASLAASSVERRPPFDKVALPSSLELYKAYLLAHLDKNGWVTTAFIKLMELKIAGDLVRDQSWINRWLAFKKAYEAEYGAPTYIPRKFKASVLKKKDVTRVVREMMKRFRYDTDKSQHGDTCLKEKEYELRRIVRRRFRVGHVRQHEIFRFYWNY